MNWLRRLFYHQAVTLAIGVVGLLVGLVGLYLYFAGQKTRELTYTVSPVRTSIVKAGEVSDLEVYYQGERVESDVNAVQIQVWNEGREPIRQAHMHEPMAISTADGAPILEAKILQQTRPENPKILDLKLDESQKARGRIGVSWRILEYRDGGIIQLTFKGRPDVKIAAAAVIEEQRAIREAPFRQPGVSWTLWVWLVVTVLLIVGAVHQASRTIQRSRWFAEHLEPYTRQPVPAEPLPAEMLHRVSITHLPRPLLWLWYSLNAAIMMIGLGAIGLLVRGLYSLGFPPTPPLAF